MSKTQKISVSKHALPLNHATISAFFYITELKKKCSHLTNITPNKFCVYHYIFVNILYTQSSNPGIFRARASRFMVLNTNLYKVLNAEIPSLVLTHADLLK